MKRIEDSREYRFSTWAQKAYIGHVRHPWESLVLLTKSFLDFFKFFFRRKTS